MMLPVVFGAADHWVEHAQESKGPGNVTKMEARQAQGPSWASLCATVANANLAYQTAKLACL
jgi:hypothetical protein